MNIEIVKDIKKANAITHNGCFHADELFCTVLLMMLMPKVFLVRIPALTTKIPHAIVYDIGGGQFDHHQPGGNGSRSNGIRYSSFGLMWRAYGVRILEEHYNCSSKDALILWNLIDEDFVQSIDCIDNGQIPKISFPTKIKSLSAGLADFYPSWDIVTPQLENEKFLEALQVAKFLFNNTVVKSISKLQAKSWVENAIENCSSSGILLLPKFMPWRTWTTNSENHKAKRINFVIFPDNRTGGYTIATVPKGPNSNVKKMLLPENWAGLAGHKLSKVCDVESAIYCHPQRHIAGAKTLLGAVEMASIAITTAQIQKYQYQKCS